MVIFCLCILNRIVILQKQQLLNFLHLLRGTARNSVSMVLLATACRICLLKDKYVYVIKCSAFLPTFIFLCQFHCFVIDGVFCRQPLLRYKIFWFLVERKRLYNVHKKVNCGDPHLFLLHNLVIRFVAPFSLSRYLHS